MANHVSATRKEIPHVTKSTRNKTINLKGRGTEREETPHANKSTRNKAHRANGKSKTAISNAIRRRAQAVINDSSIDAPTRAIIRYGLETNDPLLAELVRRVEAGETIIETIVVLKHPNPRPRLERGRDRSVDE